MNYKSRHLFFALSLSTVLVSFSIFTSLADNSILLKTGRVFTQNDFLQKQNQVPNTSEIYNGYYYRILQFNTLPTNQQKQAIELSGVQFLGYIPFNSFFVRLLFRLAAKEQRVVRYMSAFALSASPIRTPISF